MRRNEQLKLLQRTVSNLDRLTDRTKHLRSPSHTFCWLIHVSSLVFLPVLCPCDAILHQYAFCSCFFLYRCVLFPRRLIRCYYAPNPIHFRMNRKVHHPSVPLVHILSRIVFTTRIMGQRELLPSICLLSVNAIIWFIFCLCQLCKGKMMEVLFLSLSLYLSRLMMTSHTHAKAFMCDFFSLRFYHVSLGYFLILFSLSRILCLPLRMPLFNVCQSCSFCQGEVEEMRMRENDGKRLKGMKLTNQSGRHEQFTVLSTMKRRRERERKNGMSRDSGNDVFSLQTVQEKRTAVCEKEIRIPSESNLLAQLDTRHRETQKRCGEDFDLAPFPGNVLFCLFQLFSHITLNCECLWFCRVRS